MPPPSSESSPLLADRATASSGSSYGSSASTAVVSPPPAEDGDDGHNNRGSADEAPVDDSATFNRAQLLFLCYTRMVEPIAFFSVFTFVNQMVSDMGVPDTDVGFYSGLIESLFSLVQTCVMVVWGRASDRFGRKPILVVSLAGMACATTLFGFATTVWQMILFRALAGLFAGSLVTVRTMIAENCGPETQGLAYSWFAVAGNMGIFIGPLIGGALADPVRQYPGLVPAVPLLVRFPYALPSICCGLMGFSGAVVAGLFVNETLPVRVRKSSVDDGAASEYDDRCSRGPVAAPAPAPAMSMVELLYHPGVVSVLVCNGIMLVLAFGYTAVLPVFLFTPIRFGGFSFSPFSISIFMCANGLSQAIWLFLVFPPLQRRIGTRRVMRVLSFAYPLVFLPIPLLSGLLRAGTPAAIRAFWILLGVFVTIMPGISMVFTASQLIVNDASPSQRTLGTLNALALMTVTGLRSFVPAAATALYAIFIKAEWLWGQAFWLVMVAVGGAFIVSTAYLPPEKVRRGRA